MADQTDASDDLIAELARLMADDARNDKPAPAEARPIRIPGEAAAPRPQPFVPAEAPAATPTPAPAASKPVETASVRIPGGEPARQDEPEPFNFDFDFGAAAAGPASPVPEVKPVPEIRPANEARPADKPAFAGFAPRQEPSFAVGKEPDFTPRREEEAPAAEDAAHDSIADLIAAELANDVAQAGTAPAGEAEVPVVGGPPAGADTFGVPPVFGLGTTAAPAAAAPEPEEKPAGTAREAGDADPLHEIERLVGPAVHLAGSAPQPTPSPALRSLATPTIPPPEAPATTAAPGAPAARPAAEKPSPELSIDEAILAAAAATGAKVEWVEPETAETGPDRDEAVAPRRSGSRVLGMTRAFAGPLVAATLLIAAGLGLYWVLGTGGEPGPAPLLTADTSPVKEVPAEPTTASAQQSVVFNEISGVDTGAEEQIVSRDQTDIEPVSQMASVDGNQEGLVNRKVRTVTVRPDGTIVSSDDSLAGAAILPVDRPDVPEVPGADFSTPDLIASADAATPPPAATAAETPAPAVVPVEPGSTVPVVDAAGNPVPGRTAPVPLQRPADLAARVAALPAAPANADTAAPAPAQTQQPAATPVAAAPQPSAVAAPVSNAPAYVQLSSQRTEEAARQTAQDIAARFGPLFGGANLEVQRVDLGERGIFYRVRVPADSLQSANTICTNVKAAGGDCFTM